MFLNLTEKKYLKVASLLEFSFLNQYICSSGVLRNPLHLNFDCLFVIWNNLILMYDFKKV